MPNLDTDSAEVRSILGTFIEDNERLTEDIAELKEKLAVADATAKRLTESIAAANAEAEIFRQQSGELKLKLEALGLSGGSGGTSKLEQRLLAAVNDLRHGEEERKKLTESLVRLTEASMAFAKGAATKDSAARQAFEAELQHANETLGTSSTTVVEGTATPATLTDGLVIRLKEELALVVANVGTKQGVVVGMPFQVTRGGRLIGTVRVVDARERFFGALIQNLSSEKEKIQVGDRLRVVSSSPLGTERIFKPTF